MIMKSAQNQFFTATFFTLAVFAALCSGAFAYDPVTDFSVGNNQNVAGVWSYGQSATLGGAFALLPTASASDAFSVNIESWRGTAPGFAGGYPIISHNKTAVTQNYLTVTHPANELLLHPGPGGQYAVLRFTAPSAGVFRFQGVFTGRDSANTTTDVSLRQNLAIALFGAGINVSGGGNTAAFDVSPSLLAGDAVDFAVGYGNGFYGNDSTGLRFGATAVTVPEPSAFALLALPLAGAIVRRRLTVKKD